MSIIQEALKKAQSPKLPSEVAAKDLKSEPETSNEAPEIRDTIVPASPVKSVTGSKLLTLIIGAGIVITLIAISVLAWNHIFHKPSQGLLKKEAMSVQDAMIGEQPKLAVDQTGKSGVSVEQENSRIFSPRKNETGRPFDASFDKSEFQLNGIMCLEEGAQAIINNSIVVEGDKIGNIEIVKINKTSVVIKTVNGEKILYLK